MIAERAKAIGLPRAQFEENRRGAPHGHVRLTTYFGLAAVIVDELAKLAQDDQRPQLALAAAEGAAAGLKALGS